MKKMQEKNRETKEGFKSLLRILLPKGYPACKKDAAHQGASGYQKTFVRSFSNRKKSVPVPSR